jgi:ribosome modulation factor
MEVLHGTKDTTGLGEVTHYVYPSSGKQQHGMEERIHRWALERAYREGYDQGYRDGSKDMRASYGNTQNRPNKVGQARPQKSVERKGKENEGESERIRDSESYAQPLATPSQMEESKEGTDTLTPSLIHAHFPPFKDIG